MCNNLDLCLTQDISLERIVLTFVVPSVAEYKERLICSVHSEPIYQSCALTSVPVASKRFSVPERVCHFPFSVDPWLFVGWFYEVTRTSRVRRVGTYTLFKSIHRSAGHVLSSSLCLHSSALNSQPDEASLRRYCFLVPSNFDDPSTVLSLSNHSFRLKRLDLTASKVHSCSSLLPKHVDRM